MCLHCLSVFFQLAMSVQNFRRFTVSHFKTKHFKVIGPVKQNNLRNLVAIIFLSISLNMCFGWSKEPSHRDGSFEYSQHMFWLRIKKNNFQLRTLIWGPQSSKPRGKYSKYPVQLH